MDAGVLVVALVSLTEETLKLFGDFVTIEYQELSEFLFQMENVALAFENSKKVAYEAFESPEEDELVDKKVWMSGI